MKIIKRKYLFVLVCCLTIVDDNEKLTNSLIWFDEENTGTTDGLLTWVKKFSFPCPLD